jgi:catechol 2,3-dioxygenase-like lactoylglutathione lyase family enzyme
MAQPRLHHVSLASTDLARSIAFLERALQARQVERPPFSNPGAWVEAGEVSIHLNLNADGTFRRIRVIDSDDCHFAIRVADFDAALDHLRSRGFRETPDLADPDGMLVRRHGAAGFPQVFIMDPDGNVIEINAEGGAAA